MPFGGFSQPELIAAQRFIREPYELDTIYADLRNDQAKEVWVESTNVTTDSSIPDVLELYDYWTTHGERILDFYRHQREGRLLPFTFFDSFKRSGSKTPGYIEKTFGSTPNRTIDTIDSWTHLVGGEEKFVITREDMMSFMPDRNTMDYLLQSAAAEISRDSHDTLTFIAELHKTREMFLNLTRKIAAREIPKAFFRNPYKFFANHWAEARYGWRTLVFDLDSLAKAVANLESFPSTRSRAMKQNGVYSDVLTSVYYTSVIGAGSLEYMSTVVDTVVVNVRGLVAADTSPPHFGFNPLETAWELVPWSFVIDWLFSVGMALSGFSNLIMSTQHYSAVGVEIRLQREIETVLDSWNPALLSVDQSPVQASSEAKLVKRIPASVPYFPQTRVKLDEWKFLDIFAFILQRDKKYRGFP